MIKNFPRRGRSWLKEQRRRMWHYDPRCHWCGQVTVLPNYHGRVKGVQDNWATLDHLDARHSKERGKHAGEYRHVIACRKCNNERDRRELAQLPIQELWERSGSIYGIAKMTCAINEVAKP